MCKTRNFNCWMRAHLKTVIVYHNKLGSFSKQAQTDDSDSNQFLFTRSSHLCWRTNLWYEALLLTSYHCYRSFQKVRNRTKHCYYYFWQWFWQNQPIFEQLQYLGSHFILEAAIFSHDVIHMQISLVLKMGSPSFHGISFEWFD